MGVFILAFRSSIASVMFATPIKSMVVSKCLQISIAPSPYAFALAANKMSVPLGKLVLMVVILDLIFLNRSLMLQMPYL